MSVQLPPKPIFIDFHQLKLDGYMFRPEFWSSAGQNFSGEFNWMC